MTLSISTNYYIPKTLSDCFLPGSNNPTHSHLIKFLTKNDFISLLQTSKDLKQNLDDYRSWNVLSILYSLEKLETTHMPQELISAWQNILWTLNSKETIRELLAIEVLAFHQKFNIESTPAIEELPGNLPSEKAESLHKILSEEAEKKTFFPEKKSLKPFKKFIHSGKICGTLISRFYYRIEALHNLVILDIQSNLFTSLNINFKLLPKLEILDISNNPLEGKISDTIGTLSNLTTLKMNNIGLKIIPNWIGNLSSLTILTMEENFISELSFELFKNLTTLKLSTNEITAVFGKLRLEKLKNLSLLGNPIHIFSKDLIFPKLKFLDIRGHNLSVEAIAQIAIPWKEGPQFLYRHDQVLQIPE